MNNLTETEKKVLNRFFDDGKELNGKDQMLFLKMPDPKSAITSYLDAYPIDSDLQHAVAMDPSLFPLLKIQSERHHYVVPEVIMMLIANNPNDEIVSDQIKSHRLEINAECLYIRTASTENVIKYINCWRPTREGQIVLVMLKSQEPIFAFIKKYTFDPYAEPLFAARSDIAQIFPEYKKRNNIGKPAQKILKRKGLIE